MQRITATELRQKAGKQLDGCLTGGLVAIERHNRVIAYLVSADFIEKNPNLKEVIDNARR